MASDDCKNDWEGGLEGGLRGIFFLLLLGIFLDYLVWKDQKLIKGFEIKMENNTCMNAWRRWFQICIRLSKGSKGGKGTKVVKGAKGVKGANEANGSIGENGAKDAIGAIGARIWK